jgi:DNA-binding NarL/FixJ family response regulator
VRVVIADDSVLVRDGLAAMLREAGIEVAAQAASGEELVRAVESTCPDVVIVDVRMPPTHTDEGLSAAREIRERRPEVGIVILSQYVEVGLAMRLLAETAERLGYVLKDRISDLEEFVDTLRRVAEGGSALDPKIVSQLLATRRADDPLQALTAREREVLALVAQGMSNKGISERLVISEGAVGKHVTSIFTKLALPASAGDHRRVLAVLTYLRP